MKLVRFTLTGGEDTVAINPSYVVAVEGAGEEGTTIILANGESYEVIEPFGAAVDALSDNFDPPAGRLYPVR